MTGMINSMTDPASVPAGPGKYIAVGNTPSISCRPPIRTPDP